jgi:hypothetical protein
MLRLNLTVENEARQSKQCFLAVVNRLTRLGKIDEAEEIREEFWDLHFETYGQMKKALKSSQPRG